MSSDKYRLKVIRIPNTDVIPKVSEARFPPTDELYLDLIENKDKVRRNAPKPIYVRSKPEQTYDDDNDDTRTYNDVDNDGEPRIDDFTLEELENEYNNKSDNEYHNDSDNGTYGGSYEHTNTNTNNVSNNSDSRRTQYSQPRFQSEPRPSRTQPESYTKTEFAEPDIEQEDPEIIERREKSVYLVKFMILRKSNPDLDIPEFTEHSDLKSMKMAYEHAIRLTSLDQSIEQYRMYMFGGSMALEWVSTNWFGFDMNGFAKSQQKSASRYDRLLFELGEKNYSPNGSRFPVEVRLLFMMVAQAALFAFTKMQMNSSASNANNTTNSSNTGVPDLPDFSGGG